jgi:tetratricopeptide (TPR) repeat protein
MRLILALLLSVSLARADKADTFVAKGDAADAKNRNHEALPFYLAADQARPDDADILWRVAKQYSQLMEETSSASEKKVLGQKALAAAERAKAINPKNASVRLSLAIVYGRVALIESNRRKVELSRLIRDEAEAAIQLDARQDYAYHVLGRWNYEMAGVNPVLKTMGQAIYGRFPDASHEKAAEYFQKAVAIAPRQVAHHVELGRTYVALGEKEKARAEFEAALALPSVVKDDDAAKQRARLALQRL